MKRKAKELPPRPVPANVDLPPCDVDVSKVDQSVMLLKVPVGCHAAVYGGGVVHVSQQRL